MDSRNEHSISIGADAQMSAALYRLENEWESLCTRMNRRYGWRGLAWVFDGGWLADLHVENKLDIDSLTEPTQHNSSRELSGF